MAHLGTDTGGSSEVLLLGRGRNVLTPVVVLGNSKSAGVVPALMEGELVWVSKQHIGLFTRCEA